ncbi:MAG: helix-turn-helix domain-containing protein, partial [Verrucomicrobia bacterium]|nr:helix-turn-helix domain-containing protein [Verrucomicrobiota bacterium]
MGVFDETGGMRVAPAIHLSPEQREHLLGVTRAKLTPQRLATRCRVVLLADEGLQDLEISVHLGLTRQSAARWRARYLAGGFEALAKDKPGRGRKKTLPADLAGEIVRRTTQPPPTQQAWSTRTLAKAMGVSATTVRQVWRQHGLKPHLAKTFKVSNDPQFVTGAPTPS